MNSPAPYDETALPNSSKWKQYLRERFKDAGSFVVSPFGDGCIVSSPDPRIQTTIVFDVLIEEDVEYLSHVAASAGGPLLPLLGKQDLQFTPGGIRELEEVLVVPLYEGWVECDVVDGNGVTLYSLARYARGGTKLETTQARVPHLCIRAGVRWCLGRLPAFSRRTIDRWHIGRLRVIPALTVRPDRSA